MSSKVQVEPVSAGVPDAVKLGRVVYITAWIVEIVAAIVGLFIAFSQGLSVFINIPEIDRDFGAYTRAVIGALPFVVIAILEPTKIYLASGLYFSTRNRRGGLALAFMAALAALTFITFETMFNALIQQNTNVTRQVQRLVNERYETLDAIETNQLAISRIETQTPEAINTRFALSIKELEDERATRRKVAFEDYSLAVKEINANRGSVSDMSGQSAQNYFSSTVSESVPTSPNCLVSATRRLSKSPPILTVRLVKKRPSWRRWRSIATDGLSGLTISSSGVRNC